MKALITTITVCCVLLTSCYKSKCHTCTTTYVKNGVSQHIGNAQSKYCDKSRKEIKDIEKKGTYTANQYDSSIGDTITVSQTVKCD